MSPRLTRRRIEGWRQVARDTKEYLVWHRQDPSGETPRVLARQRDTVSSWIPGKINGHDPDSCPTDRMFPSSTRRGDAHVQPHQGIHGVNARGPCPARARSRLPWRCLLQSGICLRRRRPPPLPHPPPVLPVFIGWLCLWLATSRVPHKQLAALTKDPPGGRGEQASGVLRRRATSPEARFAGLLIAFSGVPAWRVNARMAEFGEATRGARSDADLSRLIRSPPVLWLYGRGAKMWLRPTGVIRDPNVVLEIPCRRHSSASQVSSG